MHRIFLNAACALALASTAATATLPSGFTETPIVTTGLSSPTAMAFAPDGRLFICQQGGSLRVVKNGSLLAAPFVTLSVNSSGERGLLGVAFDPAFTTNHFVYVYYTTATSPIHNRISRFTANGDVAAGSETVLFDLDNLSGATNHNGGAIHFGPDGKLYAAVGENASASNSQSFANVLGKMLRLNADGSIPSDNPFLTQTTGKNQAIWARGLRNPFTFAFEPGTGRMFINDVGQNTWEEINDGIAGSNYGWPTTEGETTNPSFRSPLFVYAHGSSATTGCAITGGTFFDPAAAWPAEFDGDYFFADYCSGWIRRYHPASDTAENFASDIGSPVDLAFRPDGLYYLAFGSNVVYRIEYSASQAPQITSEPLDRTVSQGQSATFSAGASGAPPLGFQWQRNRADIPGATATSYTLPAAQPSDDGALFRCVVSNGVGSAQSREAALSVIPNQPPRVTITAPLPGTLYKAGSTYFYRGVATDPEDGTSPRAAFTWQVDLHHDDHIHPFLAPRSGARSGSFKIPRSGETSVSVFYRVLLTVADSDAVSATAFVDLHPRTATVTIATDPPGLVVNVDGQPATAPFSFPAVVGMKRSIQAVSPQTLGATTYTFKSWSDTLGASHDITVPAADTTYTARFKAQP